MSEAQAGLLLLLVVPGLWGLLWLGWRGRQRRQGDVPELFAVPTDVGDAVFGPVQALYVSSTASGDWLDRVAVRGLGVRSAAEVGLYPGGVLVTRHGAPDLWLPQTALVGVRRQRGMVGTFVEADGLVVLTWRLGARALDTGLRVRRRADRDGLEAAVRAVLADPATGGERLEVPGG